MFKSIWSGPWDGAPYHTGKVDPGGRLLWRLQLVQLETYQFGKMCFICCRKIYKCAWQSQECYRIWKDRGKLCFKNDLLSFLLVNSNILWVTTGWVETNLLEPKPLSVKYVQISTSFSFWTLDVFTWKVKNVVKLFASFLFDQYSFTWLSILILLCLFIGMLKCRFHTCLYCCLDQFDFSQFSLF